MTFCLKPKVFSDTFDQMYGLDNRAWMFPAPESISPGPRVTILGCELGETFSPIKER